MTRLAATAHRLLKAGSPAVLVTVAAARGSSPRDAGARMLVTAEAEYGTVGGGRLEYEAIAEARAVLLSAAAEQLTDMPLGPALGQCCGGHVTLLLERLSAHTTERLQVLEGRPEAAVLATGLGDPIVRRTIDASDPTPWQDAIKAAVAEGIPTTVKDAAGQEWLLEPVGDRRPQVLLFGAGHVGRALAQALAPLPCAVRWVDQRPDQFPASLPEDTERVATRAPVDIVSDAPAGAYYLVMTHSHDLDFEICAAILRRADFAFAGLIGSSTKRKQFARRMTARGFDGATIARITCPIGISGTTNKQPAVIAALTAAQLLLAFERPAPEPAKAPAMGEAAPVS